MFKIIHIDSHDNVDSHMAGDPTPGRGANEFATRDEAESAICGLDEPEYGCRWAVREQ